MRTKLLLIVALLVTLALPALAQQVKESPPWNLSLAPGLVSTPFELSATHANPEASVLFTDDGSDPSLESPPWPGTYRVTSNTMLRWIAVIDDAIIARHGAAYLFTESDFADFSSDLPMVVVDSFGVDINGEGQADSRGPKRPVWSVFLERDASSKRASIESTVNFSGRAGMRVRGQSSTMFPKKQYTLELWDEEDDDHDASLLEFPEESDWILHAPFSDKTLMRNVLAYSWFREMGHYAVSTKYLELFYNDDGDTISLEDYAGVYVLMEKIKRDPGRVAIAKLDETVNALPDLSGGYIFKKDKGTQNDIHFRTPDGHRFGFVEPDEPTEAQFNYLGDHLANFENALYGRNFTDPEEGYAAYIDSPSFIDVHIHVEICRNIDGIRLSTYYHKDREGKIHMGPVWDYNLSLGNTTMRGGQYPEGWYHETIYDRDYTYFGRLFDDPNFEIAHWDRYYQLRQTVFSKAKLSQQIDALTEELREAQARNFEQWQILGVPVWQNPEGVWDRKSHADEVGWLKGWLFGRLEWLDTQFTPPPVIQGNEQALPPGGIVTTSLPGLGRRLRDPSFFYTLDGSDPRSSSENRPAASAQSLQPGASLSVNQSALLRIRAYDGHRWSALAETELLVDASLPPVDQPSGRPPGLLVGLLGAALLLVIVWKRALS